VPPGRALLPRAEPGRHQALRIAALACGLGDKAVALFYEQRLHDHVSDVWVARCRAQIGGVLAALDADRAGRPTPYWFGDAIGHADIAVACTLRFAAEALPAAVDLAAHPALQAHCNRIESLPAFQAISQTFVPPS
jgi:glutathione S-transferase